MRKKYSQNVTKFFIIVTVAVMVMLQNLKFEVKCWQMRPMDSQL